VAFRGLYTDNSMVFLIPYYFLAQKYTRIKFIFEICTSIKEWKVRQGKYESPNQLINTVKQETNKISEN
jgi:hypothetical protein